MQNLWLLKQKTWLSLSSFWKRPSVAQRSYRLSEQSGSGDYSVHGWLSFTKGKSITWRDGHICSGSKLNWRFNRVNRLYCPIILHDQDNISCYSGTIQDHSINIFTLYSLNSLNAFSGTPVLFTGSCILLDGRLIFNICIIVILGGSYPTPSFKPHTI